MGGKHIGGDYFALNSGCCCWWLGWLFVINANTHHGDTHTFVNVCKVLRLMMAMD